jgi:hypothetical protein
LQDVEEFRITDNNAGSAGSIGFKRSNSGG